MALCEDPEAVSGFIAASSSTIQPADVPHNCPTRPGYSRSMISSMRDTSVARTACGTLAGINTTDCAVVWTSRPPIVKARLPDRVRTSASNGAVCSDSSSPALEGEQRDVAGRGARQHAAGDPLGGRRHQGVQGQEFAGL